MSEKFNSLLLRNIRLGFDRQISCVRVQHGVVAAIGSMLEPQENDCVIEGRGASLLPGLHDHHLHLRAFAAALDSLRCGPPEVMNASALARKLRKEDQRCGGWLRGTAYHESVAGDIDRDWLDVHAPNRPVRIQHRSGRLWIMNSRALQHLGAIEPDAPLERIGGRPTGRLFDADGWLRERLGADPPSLAAASRRLAEAGVTGVTDATPANCVEDFIDFARCQANGDLLQRVCLMGDASLDSCRETSLLSRGATKIHLREHDLPDFGKLCRVIEKSHASARAVAAHCVTAAELAYFIEALRTAGPMDGDRIEHASIVPREWLPIIADTGATVVTQPNFILERGDQYLQDLAAEEILGLYRLRSISDYGIPLAAGSDAPFGNENPWGAMQAATARRTVAGSLLGGEEALTPEAACELFLGAPQAPGEKSVKIEVGAVADLCLLDRDWCAARETLAQTRVRLTVLAGQIIWDRAGGPREMATELIQQTQPSDVQSETNLPGRHARFRTIAPQTGRVRMSQIGMTRWEEN